MARGTPHGGGSATAVATGLGDRHIRGLADLRGLASRELARRGMRGVKLVISDAHEGIKADVSKILSATWQRCRVRLLKRCRHLDSLHPIEARRAGADAGAEGAGTIGVLRLRLAAGPRAGRPHSRARRPGARSRRLHAEVSRLHAHEGRPGIDPEAAVRLMLAGFLLGIVHDRRLLREAQVNPAIRWFAGYGLQERLPDHFSLTRIRQRWGAGRFRRIFERTVKACISAGIAQGEIVHMPR
jgi:hypothetical protein